MKSKRQQAILSATAISITILTFWFISNSSVSIIYIKTRMPTMIAAFRAPHTLPKKTDVLSYSFYGKNSWIRYGENIVTVASEAGKSKFYKNWTVRIYHDNLDLPFQKNLSTIYPNLEFRDTREMKFLDLRLIKKDVKNISKINAMTWRFIPIGDENVNTMCSRDLDSPLLEREEDAVKSWLASGKIAHVMRDNAQHGVHILGGLWCFKNSKNRTQGQEILKVLLDKAARRSEKSEAPKGDDQNVLGNFMWPKIKNDVIQHDSYLCKNYPGSIPFPSKRYLGKFAGCVQPCDGKMPQCPLECRPKEHQDWLYC